MSPKKLAKKKIIIMFFSLYLLLGGLVFTLDQASQRQANRSMAATNCGVTADQLKIKAVEQEAFNKINAYRVQNGKKALTWSPELKAPVAWLSKDMASKGYLEHTDSLGRSPEKRLNDCGVEIDGGWSENISRKGELTAQAVFEGWRNSPGHNSNMLSSDSNIGAIAVESKGGDSYWALNLAEALETSPSPKPSDDPDQEPGQDPDQNPVSGGTNCTVSAEQAKVKSVEQQAFDKINDYREQNGKTALVWNDDLKIAAAWLSKDMAASEKVEHTDSLGRNPGTRLNNCSVEWKSYAENISRKDPTAQAVFDGWKASAGHNANMLGDYSQAAISMELKGTKGYWTLNLANLKATSNPDPDPDISDSPSPSDNPDDSPKAPTPTKGPIGVDVQVSAKVTVFGIGRDGNPSPRQLTRRVTAAVYGVDKEPAAVGNAFLTYNSTDGTFTGVIHLGKLEQGAYLVKLFTDTSLQTLVKPEFQMLMIDKVNQLPAVTLYQGDITRDNIINIDDYNAVLPCFQDKRCATQNLIDFNDDGLTDVKDYNLLLRSFSQQLGN